MKLDQRTIRLIAVGASVAANCQPCLQINVTKAREEGLQEPDLADAIEIGKRVRQGAASKMDRFTLSLNEALSASVSIAEGGCGCGS
jgi:AhpD family alkylhydroperoxidase